MDFKVIHREETRAWLVTDKLWECHERVIEKMLFERGVQVKRVSKVIHEGIGAIQVDFTRGCPASSVVAVLSEASIAKAPEARAVYKATSRLMVRDYLSSTKWHGPMILEPGDELLMLGGFTGNNLIAQIRGGVNHEKRCILSAQEWDVLSTHLIYQGHLGDVITPFSREPREKIDPEGEDAISAFQRTGNDVPTGKTYKTAVGEPKGFPERKPYGDYFSTPSPKISKKRKPPAKDPSGAPTSGPKKPAMPGPKRSQKPRPRPRQRRRR